MSTHITKTWFDGEKVVTQEIPEADIYLPEALWLADLLDGDKPDHCGRAAAKLRRMHDLLTRAENEMRYAGWDKFETDNTARNGVYEQVKQFLERNT